jgi:hypothetical protein
MSWIYKSHIQIFMRVIQLSFYLFLSACFNSLFAREESSNGMLFPQFEQGVVIFKDGARTPASLNYNMMLQQMLFLEADSTIMAISGPLEIRVIVIGERRFLPVSSKGVFYEEIPAGENSFLVIRRATRLSQGKAVAYGGYSHTSSVATYDSWSDNMRTSIKLNPDEKFKLEIQYTYYLKSGNSKKKFFSANTLGKLFKGRELAIREFANERSINFSKVDDVARIVEFAYSLTVKIALE